MLEKNKYLTMHILMTEFTLPEIIQFAASSAWARKEYETELQLRAMFKEISEQDKRDNAELIIHREERNQIRQEKIDIYNDERAFHRTNRCVDCNCEPNKEKDNEL